MKNTSFIDSLAVKDPCSEKWEEMTGNDQVRFCSHCAKGVNDLTAMTRKQAMRIVRENNGSLCVRYRRDPKTGGPVFADTLHKITRRAPLMAAGVVSASLGLSAMTYAQGGVSSRVIEDRSPIATVECDDARAEKNPQPGSGSASGRIAGTVKDQMGAVIPGARLILTEEAGRRNFTVSDSAGAYVFENISAGRYSLEVTSPGFNLHITQNLTVSDETESATDITMEVSGEVFLSGVVDVSVIEYEHPLFNAVLSEDTEQLREQIGLGANVNARENNKTTPIFLATEEGSVEMVRLLLDAGAKANARNGDKETPLMRIDGDATPELIELLVLYGADVNAADKEGNTPLLRAAAEAEWPVIKSLVDAGANVNARNKAGRTAIMNAAESEDLEGVRILLEAGADVNARDKDGDSAWDLTATPEIEQVLESFGAETDGSDQDDEPRGDPDDN